jgi:hypothetical protein
MRVTLTKYTPNYNKLAEGVQRELSHSIPQLRSDVLLSQANITHTD